MYFTCDTFLFFILGFWSDCRYHICRRGVLGAVLPTSTKLFLLSVVVTLFSMMSLYNIVLSDLNNRYMYDGSNSNDNNKESSNWSLFTIIDLELNVSL